MVAGKRTVAIIQARMGSTRLPGKVMMNLAGEPMLSRIIARTDRARLIDDTIVASTNKQEDTRIVNLCKKLNVNCFRGSENDLLDRYYQAATKYRADFIVRITADNPLNDPAIIDLVVQEIHDKQPHVHFVSSGLQSTYPLGIGASVIRFDALEKAWKEDDDIRTREHVSPYIKNNPDLFKCVGISNELDQSHMRWTVDTKEDLTFVRKVYAHFGNDLFSWRDVIDILEKNPAWININSHIKQKISLNSRL